MVSYGSNDRRIKSHKTRTKNTILAQCSDTRLEVDTKEAGQQPAVEDARDVIDAGLRRGKARRNASVRAATAAAAIAARQRTKSSKRKPPYAQAIADQRSKRRIRSYQQLLPNSRLYQPKVPRVRIVQLQPSGGQPARLPAGRYLANWPKAPSPNHQPNASSVIVELTEQIATRQRQQARPKKPTAQRKEPAPRAALHDGKPSLVVNVPTVTLLSVSECSPDRTETSQRRQRQEKNPTPQGDWCEKREGRKSAAAGARTARSPSAFRRILEALDSPSIPSSDVGEPAQCEYSPTSSIFRASSPNQRALRGTKRETRSSPVKSHSSGPVRREVLRTAEPERAAARRDVVRKMSGGERAGQHEASPDDFSEGNEASAPSEFLAEFLSAIMQRKYVTALKYCKLILKYEPNNVTAKEFHPLLQEKLKTADKEEGSSGAEPPTTGSPLTDLSEDSTSELRHTGEKEDECSSYNSDYSYLPDDELPEELEVEEEEEGGRGDGGGGAAAAAARGDGGGGGGGGSSSSPSSAARAATDSNGSLPSSTGDTDISANNPWCSGGEDDDSAKYELEDDNGNAVSAASAAATRRHHARPTTARFGSGREENAAGSASNENFRKMQEALRRNKIQQLRSQFVHLLN